MAVFSEELGGGDVWSGGDGMGAEEGLSEQCVVVSTINTIAHSVTRGCVVKWR